MRILFVCMGNICRSPTAEGVFRRLVGERAPHLGLEIDSAGTHDYHVGEPPDRRAIAAASRRGIDLRNLRARQVSDEVFHGPVSVHPGLIHALWANPVEKCFPLFILFPQPIQKLRFLHQQPL